MPPSDEGSNRFAEVPCLPLTREVASPLGEDGGRENLASMKYVNNKGYSFHSLPQSRLTPCQPPRQRGPREGAFFGASSSEGAETPRTDVDFSVRLMKADSSYFDRFHQYRKGEGEINPFGFVKCASRVKYGLRHVKCLRAWVDLFHFTFCISRKFHNDRRSLFHIRRIFHCLGYRFS